MKTIMRDRFFFEIKLDGKLRIYAGKINGCPLLSEDSV
jgi:hypothetical protein